MNKVVFPALPDTLLFRSNFRAITAGHRPTILPAICRPLRVTGHVTRQPAIFSPPEIEGSLGPEHGALKQLPTLSHQDSGQHPAAAATHIQDSRADGAYTWSPTAVLGEEGVSTVFVAKKFYEYLSDYGSRRFVATGSASRQD